MREQVKQELEHIPRGNFQQNELRMAYWFWRTHSLGKRAEKNETKEDVLKKSVETIKKDYPNFAPKFDRSFFNY